MEKESWQAYENIIMNIQTVKAVETYLEGLLDERIPVFPPHYTINILLLFSSRISYICNKIGS